MRGGPGYVQTAPGVYWRDDVYAAGLARGAFPEPPTLQLVKDAG